MVAEEPPIDTENDKDFKGALDDVLGLYGMQLQSHAATFVGLSAIFAVFSLRPGNVVGTVVSALGNFSISNSCGLYRPETRGLWRSIRYYTVWKFLSRESIRETSGVEGSFASNKGQHLHPPLVQRKMAW